MGSIEDFRSEAHDWIEANLPSELRVGNRKDLPKELLGKIYYEPIDSGLEIRIREKLVRLKGKLDAEPK